MTTIVAESTVCSFRLFMLNTSMASLRPALPASQPSAVASHAIVMQHKTHRPVQFEITEPTALEAEPGATTAAEMSRMH